ncbi:MAG: hypothetical protein HQ478_02360 [Chloroflexi bacterium]|nr:hypothetical protein [Chloroflexota bacterium]
MPGLFSTVNSVGRRPNLRVSVLAVFVIALMAAALLFSDGASAAGPPITVKDKFNGGGTTQLEAHTPNDDLVGGGWSEAVGDWKVSKGAAFEITGEQTPYYAIVDSTFYNFDLNVDITYPGNSDVGLLFRYQDEDNWFGLIYTGKKLEIWRTVNGETDVLDKSSYEWAAGESHILNLSVEDDVIEGSIDGTEAEVAKSDLSLQFNSRVGLYFQRDNATRFHDFEVANLGSPSPQATISFPSASSSILFDNFGGGGTLSGHTPDIAPTSSAWSLANGVWDIAGGSVNETSAFGGDARAFVDPGTNDVDVYAEIDYQGSGLAGVVYRYQDESNWYMSWYDGTNLATGKMVAGAFEFLGVKGYEWGPTPSTRIMRVRADATTVHVYIDDSLPLATLNEPDPFGPGSQVGLFSRLAPGHPVGRFAVTTPAPLPFPDLPFYPPGPPPTSAIPPTPPTGVDLFDSFSDFPWAGLNYHSIDIAPGLQQWSSVSGAWFADYNQGAERTGNFADRRAVIDTGANEQLVNSKIDWDGGRAGIVFNYQNESNWAMFWYDGVADLVVAKAVGGLFKEMGRSHFEWEEGKKHELTAEVVAGVATAYLDEDALFTFDVSELQDATEAGMFVRTATPQTYDNFALFADATQPVPPSPPTTTLVEDTFSDLDATPLESHTPDIAPIGSSWLNTSPFGDWEIQTGQAVETTLLDWADHRSVIDAGVSDATAEVDLTWNAGGGGLVLRHQDDGNWIMAWVDGGSLVVGKLTTAAGFQVLHSAPLNWGGPGVTRNLSATLIGADITISVDGSVITTVTISDLIGATEFGIFTRGSSSNEFDNFKVWVFGAGPPPVPGGGSPGNPGPLPGGSAIIVLDSFDAADGTSLIGRQPDVSLLLSRWERGSLYGQWKVDGNASTETSLIGWMDHRLVVDAGTHNVTVEADITWNQRTAGLVARYQDNANWIMAWYDGKFLVLGEATSADGFKVLSRERFKWGSESTTHHLSLNVTGFNITVFVDGESIVHEEIDNPTQATRHGLFNRSTRANSFDNFSISSDTPPAPAPPPEQQFEIIFDSFTAANGQTLAGRSPDVAPAGSTWSETSLYAIWEITENKVAETTLFDWADHRAVIDAGNPDVTVQVDMTWNEFRAGITFRYLDESNWAMAWFEDDHVSIAQSSPTLGFQEIGRFEYDWGTPGTTRTFQVVLSGDEVVVSIDGTTFEPVSLPEPTTYSSVGLFTRAAGTNLFDDFRVLGPAPEPTTVFSDSFTADDGIAPADRTSDVSLTRTRWDQASPIGEWEIRLNRLVETSGVEWADHRLVVDAGTSGATVRADVTWQSRGAGLVVRYEDEHNWVMAWIDGSEVVLGQVTASGGFHVIGHDAFDWGAPGTTRLLEARNQGATITVLVDGVEVLVSDVPILMTSTRYGLFSRSGDMNSFENFEVTSITPPAPETGLTYVNVIEDAFGDVNGTDLNGNLPDVGPASSTWMAPSLVGEWESQNGVAIETTGIAWADHRLVIDSGVSDGVIEADITLQSGIAGLVLRYQDESNWIMVWATDSGVWVGKVTAESGFKLIARYRYNWGSAGTTKNMKAHMTGDQIVIEVDGRQFRPITESDLITATSHGLFSRSAQSNAFDNFFVKVEATP